MDDLLYLTRKQVTALLPSIRDQIDIGERTYRAMAAGEVELPPKPGGFVSFLMGTAAGNIAIPAVLGSQFSIVAALIGILLFGERLVRVQIIGLGITVAGVAILAAQTA